MHHFGGRVRNHNLRDPRAIEAGRVVRIARHVLVTARHACRAADACVPSRRRTAACSEAEAGAISCAQAVSTERHRVFALQGDGC